MKKLVSFLLCLLLCVKVTIAQTDYYYYKGKAIPLSENNKVCVSIPKDKAKTTERILANVRVLDTITDEHYDIYVIPRSNAKELISLYSWNEDAKSVILTPSYKTSDGAEVFTTPYLNIRLKKEEDVDLLRSYAEKYGLSIIKQDPLMPLWYILAITQDCDKNTLECANELWESGKFAASIPDLCSEGLICSNDPMFNQQWGLHNSNYPGIDISVSSAWNYSTGKNIKIAILDTGVDMNQIDLSSNISSLSYDTETHSSPSVYYREHATNCAGIAAAVKDNGVQIAGVAPEATIVSISNLLLATPNNQLKLADGIIWAYQHGIDIISNSWRTKTYHDAIDEAIQDAFIYGRQGKGCVIAFASGNDYDSVVGYPANCNDTILAVGSINNTGLRAEYSNYGVKLDIVAPGNNILTTHPNNQLVFGSGTSMACPHVAGVAALILERNPELTVNQVNSIINSTAKKLSGVNFNIIKPDGLWNNEYGYGLVDAYSSVINTPCPITYIQNDTITGTRIILADSIYVGKDVTNTKEYGDVILGQGDITLKGGYIEIKNSTTVPLGTILKIEN